MLTASYVSCTLTSWLLVEITTQERKYFFKCNTHDTVAVYKSTIYNRNEVEFGYSFSVSRKLTDNHGMLYFNKMYTSVLLEKHNENKQFCME